MEDVCRTDRWLCSTLWVENNQCQTQCGMVFEWRCFQRGPHKVTMTSAFWLLIGMGLSEFTLRSIWPVQPVTETRSSHIRMVTVIQSVCPSTEIKFRKHLRCFEVGRVVFSGKCGAYGINLLFSCAKGPAWYHCLWFGGQGTSLSHVHIPIAFEPTEEH